MAKKEQMQKYHQAYFTEQKDIHTLKTKYSQLVAAKMEKSH